MRPFSVPQLADRWQCSEQHIRDLVSSGALQHFRLGRLIRIPDLAVRDYESCSPDTEASGLAEPPTVVDFQLASPPSGVIVKLPNGRPAKSSAPSEPPKEPR